MPMSELGPDLICSQVADLTFLFFYLTLFSHNRSCVCVDLIFPICYLTLFCSNMRLLPDATFFFAHFRT